LLGAHKTAELFQPIGCLVCPAEGRRAILQWDEKLVSRSWDRRTLRRNYCLNHAVHGCKTSPLLYLNVYLCRRRIVSFSAQCDLIIARYKYSY